jgi:hypothetical protein
VAGFRSYGRSDCSLRRVIPFFVAEYRDLCPPMSTIYGSAEGTEPMSDQPFDIDGRSIGVAGAVSGLGRRRRGQRFSARSSGNALRTWGFTAALVVIVFAGFAAELRATVLFARADAPSATHLYGGFDVKQLFPFFPSFIVFAPVSLFDLKPVSPSRPTRNVSRRAQGPSRSAVAPPKPHAPQFPGRIFAAPSTLASSSWSG